MSIRLKVDRVQNHTLNREVPSDGGGRGDEVGGDIVDEGQDPRLPWFKSCFTYNFECNSR